MPSTWEMPTARTITHILSGKLSARSGVEHMRVTVELTLEGLPVDQTNGP
jgi:hypothetical protein